MTSARWTILFAVLTAGLAHGAAVPLWKAGAAKVRITPRQSMWMAGYASRSKPSAGVAQDLCAAALALEDQQHRRAVLVTVDLLRVTPTLTRRVAARIAKKYGVPRERLLLNSSHTHSGPAIAEMPSIYYSASPEFTAALEAYTRELEDKLVEVVGMAIGALKPARIAFGRTEASFARNRRTSGGPVDHDVPFLRIEDGRGKLRSIVFGYACHGTTNSEGPEFYQFHGDWQGAAKERLDRNHPGSVSLFVAGCGADSDPFPRGKLAVVQEHGFEIASAVEKAMGASLKPVSGPLRCAWDQFPLAFAPPPSRDELQAQLQDKRAIVRLHASKMLEILDRDGRLPTEYPYVAQAWQFGSDLTLVALAGEVVVDYDLRLKKELGTDGLWVAAYSNDVFGYVPSLRVLREGGYEGGAAMTYTIFPGPFAPTVEETIVGKVRELVARVRSERGEPGRIVTSKAKTGVR